MGQFTTPALKGYTRHIIADGDSVTLELMVKPDTDFDDTFRAYDMDTQEWLNVNGWLFIVEDL